MFMAAAAWEVGLRFAGLGASFDAVSPVGGWAVVGPASSGDGGGSNAAVRW